MRIYPINTENFKLDGGAMFGVVPKSIWSKTNPPDDKNLIEMTMRCMLVEDGKKLTLIDTGIGSKQSEKFLSYYYLCGDNTLTSSLNKLGFSPDDITDVFLTHLHFDHCGGAVNFNKSMAKPELAFKNANYWSNKNHWQWAIEPNDREKASFLKENILPIEESGNLKFIDIPKNGYSMQSNELGFEVLFFDGHTDKQMLPKIKYKNKTIVFAADLIPTTGHIPLAYVMGYDTRPLQTLKEKKSFMEEAVENDYLLFLEHDAYSELCSLKKTERGVRLDQTYSWKELFN